MADWIYDARANNYRDEQSGRFLPKQTIIDLRDRLADARSQAATSLSERLWLGEMDLEAWQVGMRATIRDAQLVEYLFGRGGKNAMTPADFGAVGRSVRDQYAFLRSFAVDIADGRYTDAETGELKGGGIIARAAQYAGSGAAAHSRGMAAARGLELPAHPGDGGTPCHGNCHCSWAIEETADEWRATWVIGSDNPCSGCTSRRAEWAPYVQPKAREGVAA